MTKSRLGWRKNTVIYTNALAFPQSKKDAFQVKSVASVHHRKTEDDFVEWTSYKSYSVALPSVRRGYVVLC